MSEFILYFFEYKCVEYYVDTLPNPFNTTYYKSVFVTESYYGDAPESIPGEARRGTIFAEGTRTVNYTYHSTFFFSEHDTTETYYGYIELASGQYVYSNSFTVDFTTLPDPPAPATGLAAEIINWFGSRCSVNLTWDEVELQHFYGAYLIYGPNSETVDEHHGFSSDVSELFGIGYHITLNSTYTFKVVIENTGGLSPESTVTITTPLVSLSPIISNLAITGVTTSQISITWDSTDMSGSGINHYEIYFTGQENEVTTTNTSYTFSNLTPATHYYIRINAYDNMGNFTQSEAGYAANCLVWTLSEGSFEWDAAKVSGQSFNVTANEWTRFQNMINSKRVAYGLSNYSFTTVLVGNQFTASIFNKAVTAINEIYTKRGDPTQIHTDIRYGVSIGETIYAWYFDNIRDALNSV